MTLVSIIDGVTVFVIILISAELISRSVISIISDNASISMAATVGAVRRTFTMCAISSVIADGGVRSVRIVGIVDATHITSITCNKYLQAIHVVYVVCGLNMLDVF